MSNEELLVNLEQWARERRIWPRPSETFRCEHYDDCHASLQKNGFRLDRGNTCQMSYVGREYGELGPSRSFRLVIVGIDHGANYNQGGEPEGFIECQKGIEGYYYGQDWNKRHNHYHGVIKTAAAIFGAVGRHCLDHCCRDWRCYGEKRPAGFKCALWLFAQANLVKCIPREAESRKTKSTNEMFSNCPQHLLSELEVLKPDLVVFHGVNAEWAFPKALTKRNTQTLLPRYTQMPLPSSPKHGETPMVQEVTSSEGAWKFHVLYLLHPARGGLDRKWDDVERALKLLRSHGAVPL